MKQEKNKWLEEVLNSTEGMHTAEPPAGMFERIMDRAKRPGVVRTISLSTLSAAAACLLILLSLNLMALKGHDRSSNANAPVQDLAEYYDLNPDNYGL